MLKIEQDLDLVSERDETTDRDQTRPTRQTSLARMSRRQRGKTTETPVMSSRSSTGLAHKRHSNAMSSGSKQLGKDLDFDNESHVNTSWFPNATWRSIEVIMFVCGLFPHDPHLIGSCQQEMSHHPKQVGRCEHKLRCATSACTRGGWVARVP